MTQRGGACFLAGQAVEDPAMHRHYRRFTHSFRVLHCYLSGRGLRAFAKGAERPIRELVRTLPTLERNREP